MFVDVLIEICMLLCIIYASHFTLWADPFFIMPFEVFKGLSNKYCLVKISAWHNYLYASTCKPEKILRSDHAIMSSVFGDQVVSAGKNCSLAENLPSNWPRCLNVWKPLILQATLKVTVIKVIRIQNLWLWEAYDFNRMRIMKRNWNNKWAVYLSWYKCYRSYGNSLWRGWLWHLTE